MNYLQESLYWLTSGLLVPCILFLLYMLIQSLMAVGQYLSTNKQSKAAMSQLVQWSQSKSPLQTPLPASTEKLTNYQTYAQVISYQDSAQSRLLVSHLETDIEQQLSRYSNLAKLGPITGLVGTLIPMGPALQGLADGNIQQLAQQMQIAFTTTVIGLIIGAIGFTLHQIHKRQSFKELALFDFILDKQEQAGAN